MKLLTTINPDVKLIEPDVFEDTRGFFFESFNQRKIETLIERKCAFVQDNHSGSCMYVLRGLHYQVNNPQGKLLRVINGEVLDVAVDLRKSSPYFGKWESFILSSENRYLAWVPEGFAHGFLVLSEKAEVLYKATDYYAPENERCIIWNDPTLNIEWPLNNNIPVISQKDQQGCLFSEAEYFP